MAAILVVFAFCALLQSTLPASASVGTFDRCVEPSGTFVIEHQELHDATSNGKPIDYQIRDKHVIKRSVGYCVSDDCGGQRFSHEHEQYLLDTSFKHAGRMLQLRFFCEFSSDSSPAQCDCTQSVETENSSVFGNEAKFKDGSFISKTRETIPPFPSSLPGYYHVQGEDFWGKPYEEKGSIRVFEGSDWADLPDFPSTQNGCSSGRFVVRWRSANPDVTITAGLFFAGEVITHSESGVQGYMMGSNCHQPRFRFSGKTPGNQATLADVYYEVRFWRAGV